MDKMILRVVVTFALITSFVSCSENEDDCPVTATIVEIGADCGYRYFSTGNGFLHPDQDVLQELQTLNPDLDLSVGATVQIGFRAKDDFDMRCLVLFAEANPIEITCISVGGEAVVVE